MENLSIQEIYAPRSICFGCGPANQKGLHIKSYPESPDSRVLVCEWQPEAHHEAFPGVLNGGIIGALLDCHSNWTASNFLRIENGLAEAPCTVTAFFNVELKRPTPSKEKVQLCAWVTSHEKDRAHVEATLTAGGKVCATCKGLFVSVKEGHPAFFRWNQVL